MFTDIMIIVIIYTIILSPAANGLMGFDCGGQRMNITSVSLLSVDKCDLKYHAPNSSEVYIQLLQLSEYNYAEVMQCKVQISRRIQYCGMHSHISAVNNARVEYFLDIDYTRCLRIFQDGTLTIGNSGIIDGLKPNTSDSRSIMLTGSVKNDGSCQGTQYSEYSPMELGTISLSTQSSE